MVSVEKRILENRIFLGYYHERRYIAELQTYRDIVIISPAEIKLISDLLKFKEVLSNRCGIKCLGIEFQTESRDISLQHSLWVQLKDVPLGHFWFQIKNVQITDGEANFKLKCIRELKLEDYKSIHWGVNSESEKEDTEKSEEYTFKFDLAQIEILFYSNLKSMVGQIGQNLTLQNFISVTRLFASTALLLMIESIPIIMHLGEYTLKLLEMLIHFMEVASPILNHLISAVTKIIGGFYFLLAIIFNAFMNEKEKPCKYCKHLERINTIPNTRENYYNRLKRLEF